MFVHSYICRNVSPPRRLSRSVPEEKQRPSPFQSVLFQRVSLQMLLVCIGWSHSGNAPKASFFSVPRRGHAHRVRGRGKNTTPKVNRKYFHTRRKSTFRQKGLCNATHTVYTHLVCCTRMCVCVIYETRYTFRWNVYESLGKVK